MSPSLAASRLLFLAILLQPTPGSATGTIDPSGLDYAPLSLAPTAPTPPRFSPEYRPRAAFEPRAAGSKEFKAPVKFQLPPEARREDVREIRQRFAAKTSVDGYREALVAATAFAPATATEKDGSAWTAIGSGIASGTGGLPTAGRITQALYAYDHTQARTTLWLAASSGGLWKLVVPSSGPSYWQAIGDSLPGSPSVGAFWVDPSDSQHLLVGSGDRGRYAGSGLYESLDGGGSWLPRSPLGNAMWVSAIRANHDVSAIYAATDTGIWRSLTRGQTWTRQYDGAVTDLERDPGSPTSQYWYAGAPTIGVLESSDGGNSFHPIAGSGGNGIPDDVGFVALAVSESAPNYVYAMVAKGNNRLNDVYRSSDYGYNFMPILDSDDVSWGLAFFTGAIAVHPTNPARVAIVMGGAKMSANASGASVTWQPFDGAHSDFTSVQFVPQSLSPGNTNLVVSNDGGYYIHNYTNGVTDGSGNLLGLNVAQVMNSPNTLAAARLSPNTLLAGLQDNGMLRIQAAASPALTQMTGGDGGQASISPDSSNHWFFSNGVDYRRYYSLDAMASSVDINCSQFRYEWSMSVLRDPRPGQGLPRVATYSEPYNARLDGSQNLSTTPLTVNETLGINAPDAAGNRLIVAASLAVGDDIWDVIDKVNAALTAAAAQASAGEFYGRLRIATALGGADQYIIVNSNRSAGPGTTGFGTGAQTAYGSNGYAWFKDVAPTCNWVTLSTTAFPANATTRFYPWQIDQAMQATQAAYYLTGNSDRVYVLDQGNPGAMTWQVRTPQRPGAWLSTSARVAADRSGTQPDTLYYVTYQSRPAGAFLSTNRGLCWKNVTGNLPTSEETHELIANPLNLNQLFLATRTGLWRSDNRGRYWYRWMSGLPQSVDVEGIELSYLGLAEPLLRISTYGRGFWQRSVSSTEASLFSEGFDCQPASAL